MKQTLLFLALASATLAAPPRDLVTKLTELEQRRKGWAFAPGQFIFRRVEHEGKCSMLQLHGLLGKGYERLEVVTCDRPLQRWPYHEQDAQGTITYFLDDGIDGKVEAALVSRDGVREILFDVSTKERIEPREGVAEQAHKEYHTLLKLFTEKITR